MDGDSDISGPSGTGDLGGGSPFKFIFYFFIAYLISGSIVVLGIVAPISWLIKLVSGVLLEYEGIVEVIVHALTFVGALLLMFHPALARIRGFLATYSLGIIILGVWGWWFGRMLIEEYL
jgi:hypothetical protein